MEVDLCFLLGSKVQALLSTHPNSWPCNLDIIPDIHWPLLVQFYVSDRSDQPIPQDLADIINQIKLYQLPRTPMPIPKLLRPPSEAGMSPKKSHEVARMVTYIMHLILTNNLLGDQLRIVDAGAGQGYLTRSLKYHLPRVHILALDADAGQTKGAQRWERRLLPDAHPPIQHKTIVITSQSLLSVVDEWIHETRSPDDKSPISVLFVALHACGSLTLDILRAYVSSREGTIWSSAGVVAVGCCYNLMHPSDFPLSHAYGLSGDQPFRLPNSAFHLAAQIPSEWLQSPIPVNLAFKKIVFRAILTGLLRKARPATHKLETWENRSDKNPTTVSVMPVAECLGEPDPSETGINHTPRLGKLNDRLYDSWPTFLRAVEEKLVIKFAEDVFNEETKGFTDENAKATFERKIQALHTMRCLLGSVVESIILRDRVQWMKDALSGSGLQIQLVNLFDQSTGSGRNVAIVIAPQLPFDDLPR